MWPKYCVALVSTRYDLFLLQNLIRTIELFWVITAIIHHLPCCYVVTTSKIGQYG